MVPSSFRRRRRCSCGDGDSRRRLLRGARRRARRARAVGSAPTTVPTYRPFRSCPWFRSCLFRSCLFPSCLFRSCLFRSCRFRSCPVPVVVVAGVGIVAARVGLALLREGERAADLLLRVRVVDHVGRQAVDRVAVAMERVDLADAPVVVPVCDDLLGARLRRDLRRRRRPACSSRSSKLWWSWTWPSWTLLVFDVAVFDVVAVLCGAVLVFEVVVFEVVVAGSLASAALPETAARTKSAAMATPRRRERDEVEDRNTGRLRAEGFEECGKSPGCRWFSGVLRVNDL